MISNEDGMPPSGAPSAPAVQASSDTAISNADFDITLPNEVGGVEDKSDMLAIELATELGADANSFVMDELSAIWDMRSRLVCPPPETGLFWLLVGLGNG